jgi:two-component system, NarL family, sensor kinase
MYFNLSQTGWYLVGACIFIVILFTLFLFFYLMSRQRHNELIMKEHRLKHEYHQELLRTQLEIQEQTFKNISQEIHDNIGQALTLAKLNLNTMPQGSGEQQEKITTTKELVSKAIVDLRDLSRSLNTDYVADMGLQKAIEYELGLISKSSNIITNMQLEGEPFRMDKQKELILFRIVQEVLNNTLKHAGATTIHAKINYGNNDLQLSVTDNGKGFLISDTQNENQSGSGLGLRNMDNRAKLIGATFSMNSKPGNGTEVRIILPQIPDDKDSSPTAKTVF